MSSLSLGKKPNRFFQSNIVRVMMLSVLMLDFISACTSTPVQPSNATPAQPSNATPAQPSNATPDRTATVSFLRSREGGGIRFMTYNVQVGGWGPMNDLENLITVLKTYNPDVLGIQEANGWDQNDFAIANRVANALGMDYVYCKSVSGGPEHAGNSFDTLILSKFIFLDSGT